MATRSGCRSGSAIASGAASPSVPIRRSCHQTHEFPEHEALSPKNTGGSSAVFYLATDDVDALVARAVAAGAQLTRATADWFTGERDAQITDPFGHRWGLTQHIRDVPRDEIERAAIEAFSGADS
jgi:PhnB protein